MSFDFTQNRLDNAERRVHNFIDENIVTWTDEEIGSLARKNAFDAGLKSEVATGIVTVKDGFMKAKVTWSLFNEERKPLHLFLEKGTKGPYIIRALGKIFGGADSLRWLTPNGKPIFRKKVRHPGIEPRNIMKNAEDKGKPILQKRVATEVNNFLEVNRLS